MDVATVELGLVSVSILHVSAVVASKIVIAVEFRAGAHVQVVVLRSVKNGIEGGTLNKTYWARWQTVYGVSVVW
jgi:hypothetical protein